MHTLRKTDERQMEYALAPRRQQFRVAAENPRKAEAVKKLIEKEKEYLILIIGEYLDQLKNLAQLRRCPRKVSGCR